MMNREVFFLKDSGINDWLISGFKERNFPVKFIGMKSPHKNSSFSRIRRIQTLHYRYLSCAYNCLSNSKRNDVIVCFLDVMGLYVFVLSKILFKRREMLVINIMFNARPDLITYIKKLLYRWMLRSEHVHPTVASPELSSAYRRLFRVPGKKFYLLHDCYGDLEKTQVSPHEVKDYIFCGGSNGRDWGTIKGVASLLPHINFVIVGPQENTLGSNIPPNISYHFNVSYAKFNQLIRGCSFLALPLDTEAPAGLIVMFTAGLMSKAVITTNNFTMREYITSGEDGILVKMGDVEKFAEETNALYQNLTMQLKFGQNLCKRIEELGSPGVFIDTIIYITRQIASPIATNYELS